MEKITNSNKNLPAHTPSCNLGEIGPNRTPTQTDGSNDWRCTVGASDDGQPRKGSMVESNTAVERFGHKMLNTHRRARHDNNSPAQVRACKHTVSAATQFSIPPTNLVNSRNVRHENKKQLSVINAGTARTGRRQTSRRAKTNNKRLL